MKSYKYLSIFAGIFTAVLIISNILNTKLFVLFGFAFPAGILTFPISFLLADALTEVYGYAPTRKIIWTGFGILVFMALMSWIAIRLPGASFWPNQTAFATLLAQVPRLVFASILAFWCGEFANSYVLAKSKVRTQGKGMAVRFITSTMAGQAIDTVVFMGIAFTGIYPAGTMLTLFLSSWVLKVAWEVVALPISIPFVRWLKKAEQEDHIDQGTNFSPFRLEESSR